MINCSPLGDTQTGYVNGAALAAGNVLRTRDETDHSYSIDMNVQRTTAPPQPSPEGREFPPSGGIKGGFNLKSKI